MSLKILFLNGPPGCGKDTAAEMLEPFGWHHLKFATPLKLALSELLDMPVNEIEKEKGALLPDGKTTIRDLLIRLSEDVVKPVAGDAHFGELAARKVVHIHKYEAINKFVFSDSGFEKEVYGCLSYLNDLGLRFSYDIFKIVRPGCSFTGDSRSYLKEGTTIDNDGSFEKFRIALLQEIEQW